MTNGTEELPKTDIYAEITKKIIADLEKGTPTWRKPWKDNNGMRVTRPLRHNDIPYTGVNTMILWAEAAEKNYSSPYWMTYRQALELGAHVREHEKGTHVVFSDKYIPDQKEDQKDEKENSQPKTFLKVYTVFNAEQIEGLPDSYYPIAQPVNSSFERIKEIEDFCIATHATIYTGKRAFYSDVDDQIEMPPFENFDCPESYYITQFHEIAHWTKHPSRLNRDFNQKRFGDSAYAKEELVAELAACFLAADFGIELTPHKEHSPVAYIQSWLRVLKQDKRFIFQAASYAQKTIEYLKNLQSVSRNDCLVPETEKGVIP